MTSKKVTIKLESGLEARPVAMLVQVASQYDSDIYVESASKRINAKSIMSIMTACIKQGSEIEIRCDGEDEEEALTTAVKLVESGLGEL